VEVHLGNQLRAERCDFFAGRDECDAVIHFSSLPGLTSTMAVQILASHDELGLSYNLPLGSGSLHDITSLSKRENLMTG